MSPKETELCRQAYYLQDACNITAVAGSLHTTLIALREEGLDESGRRHHPAVIAIVDKINDMLGRLDFTAIDNSFDIVAGTTKSDPALSGS